MEKIEDYPEPLTPESRPMPKRQNNFWYFCNESPTVLVFIHGIFSDSRGCWLFEDSKTGERVFWPDLLLRDDRFDMPPSIYLAGYYTEVLAGDYGIRACAREVLGKLQVKGTDKTPPVLNKQNIIFVCHSTGGVVVRYLLSQHDELFREKGVGVALIASPTLGSIVANVASLAAGYYNQRLGLTLRVGDKELEEIRNSFQDLVDQKAKRIPRLMGAEACETRMVFRKKLPRWIELCIPNRWKVVSTTSGSQHFGAPTLLRDTDHFSTVKPNNLEHPAHDFIYSFMERFHAEIEKKNPDDQPPDINAEQIFNVPLPQNKFFTGREDILQQLRSNFASGEHLQSLNGLGGIGKTQTALEYAYRYREEYQVILWGKAHTRASLVSDFAVMASWLNLPQKDAKDQGQVIEAVKRWLTSHNKWLLILDNADELDVARDFIPTDILGHVILTTRASYVGDLVTPHTVEKMTPQEGTLFLLRKTRKLKNDQPLESAPHKLRTQAETLSNEFDGLPLALNQAAAFIVEMQTSLEEYRKLYESEQAKLLSQRGQLTQDDHPSVTVTFSLAFKKVAEASPEAADLLRACAFLAADTIPEEIFSEGGTELGEVLSAVVKSPLAMTKAIGEAMRYSLLRRSTEAKTLGLHRLVQEVLRAEMDADTKRMWAERVIRAVNVAFPNVEFSNWPLCERLISHAKRLARVIEEYSFEFQEAARLLNQAGNYLGNRAQYAEAEAQLVRARAIYEKTLGTDHLEVAPVLSNLAWLCHDQGKYADAETLYERALAIREKEHGPDHLDVADSLNGLAEIYYHRDKYAEAEPLLVRALAIREKLNAVENSSFASYLHNLAKIYVEHRKYAEAEPLLVRALAIQEKALNAEDPAVAISLNNLAGIYYRQSKYAEAEPLLVRALAIKERSLHPEDPEVAASLNNLAMLYIAQGNYAEAEPLFVRALAIYEKSLHAEHPAVATMLENYASLLLSLDKKPEAEKLTERASAIRKRYSRT